MRRASMVLLTLMIGAPALAQQQQPAAPEPPVIVTSGEAVVKRAPDRAWVTISAEARAKTPGEAQQQNAAAMSAVVEKLRAAGIPKEAIQTIAIDLQPEFDYHEGKQSLRGYVARNSIEVRVDTLPKLGDIIDMSVSAGAARVGGVRFDLQDRDAAEREALKLAVGDARERAAAAAAGAGMEPGRVLRIEEHRMGDMPPPRPMAMREMMTVQDTTTPVVPGEIEIRASVTLTVELK